jgi:hypothetical protein
MSPYFSGGPRGDGAGRRRKILRRDPGDGGHAMAILDACSPSGELAGCDLEPRPLTRVSQALTPFHPPNPSPSTQLRLHRRTSATASAGEPRRGPRGSRHVVGELDDEARGFSFQGQGAAGHAVRPRWGPERTRLVNAYDESSSRASSANTARSASPADRQTHRRVAASQDHAGAGGHRRPGHSEAVLAREDPPGDADLPGDPPGGQCRPRQPEDVPAQGLGPAGRRRRARGHLVSLARGPHRDTGFRRAHGPPP